MCMKKRGGEGRGKGKEGEGKVKGGRKRQMKEIYSILRKGKVKKG